ncbi:NADH:ubiquinone oxidoreductase 20.1kD subunit [Pseudovirgaria hyperparasitica]|uniref:NADH:ubiquinone oxidoreductase 20.1kD subunit n=1 Tax=Pseudovirgaria hyperparasitica TaxID=470096 RepID=A0A6A6W9N4_9PEZI|nr:NADH:ubiquinone oxidoreductase 20.1kD subunit [Pseudovirgaria hyperparasitica]KAF2758660.1 NADH:ubiquinone oxidoreductase 20.1kD subunit [Pseudovirgaria hyperparasitica]
MASVISRGVLRTSRASCTLIPATKSAIIQARPASQYARGIPSEAELDPNITDPNMNGGYINPPREKRQFRDPYGDWHHHQRRKNFGEPVHEDDDVLGMFSPEEYTWTKPGKGALMFGTFILAYMGLLGVVYLNYPDKQSVPKSYPGGLDVELGGKGSLRARQEGDPEGVRAVDNI